MINEMRCGERGWNLHNGKDDVCLVLDCCEGNRSYHDLEKVGLEEDSKEVRFNNIPP